MRSSFKMFLAAAMIGTGLFAIGCQSTGASTASAAAPDKALTCTKCEVTWVKVPTDGGKGRVVGYTSKKTMVCPDCKDAVSNFFATGKFQHTCTTCGDSMEMCETH